MAKLRTQICTAPGCDNKSTTNWRDGANCYCNVHYQRMYCRGSLHPSVKIPALPKPVCAVDGCKQRCRSRNSRYCETHYYRKRRGNDPTVDPIYGYRSVDKRGYVGLRKCTHPLSTKDGFLYEHRRVTYDTHGPNCPNCFWCGVRLTWAKAAVDHLNEIKDDNRSENLVVACNDCNRVRGMMIPFIRSLRPEALPMLVETFDLMRARLLR